MKYSNDDLRKIFQQQFNKNAWKEILRDLFKTTELRVDEERILDTSDEECGWFLGRLTTSDNYRIGLFRYDIINANVAKKKVGLHKLVKSFVNSNYGDFDAALVVFVGNDNWRLSFICDIKGSATAPKRYTFLFGDHENRYNTAVTRFLRLQEQEMTFNNIREAFSVEALSKEFYTRLYKWYEWALSEDAGITFPNNPQTSEDVREDLNIKLIRLLTRLLFVWFIKQKKLVPDDLFSPSFLKGILKDFNEDSMKDGCFYNAILQNLFFATLNCAIYDDNKMTRSFSSGKPRDIKNRYRYAEMFSISKEEVLELFARIPFLNGGLFECLDYPHELYKKLDHDILYDGFSRNATLLNGFYKYRAFIPNKLFFNDDENQPGLITLLKEYNFTIEENSRDDAEVSLDPELLGQVFENLLAAYNPETQESARKATGSFYTPRVIVDYMVDESLKAYIKGKNIEGIEDNLLQQLFNEHSADKIGNEQRKMLIQALKEVKILDPACGSGAFPMGCLLRIVDIIEILHDNNFDRYNLKLEIIENCIFGIDIQSIAMMICKLRFFISLICDQENIDFSKPKENFGVNTLPNLETKFVAANTLLCADVRKFDNTTDLLLPNDETLTGMKDELLKIRNEHFIAKSRSIKIKTQDDDERIRERIHNHILKSASKPDNAKIANLTKELEKSEKELEVIKNSDLLIQTQIVKQESLFGEKKIQEIDLKPKRIKEKERQIQSIKADINREINKATIQGFEASVKQLTDWDPYDQNSVSPFFDAEWMFGIRGGFDIVVGNPPYISTKEVSDEDKDAYEKEFGFSDDTYNLFTFKGLSLCKDNASLTYIIPKTFWTTQTKRNMRELLLSNSIEYIYDTANPFESVMVDTCIIQVKKSPYVENHSIRFIDGIKSYDSPHIFEPIKQSMYINAHNMAIFKPTDLNLRIFELYNDKVKSLYKKWWKKIETSKKIEKNKTELEAYRESLKPGDVALLGCLTEGGQGLATANNGKYIAVRRSSKWAENIMISRPKKLKEAIKNNKINILALGEYNNEKEYLSSLSEKEIAQLFDSLKEKYGRDIFGQGYLYKIIEDDEIADVNSLSKEEKENGIDESKKYYVPYDKGDKDGNRWYLDTPYAIAWTKENVRFLKTDPKARYQGYTYYFREGFCWIDVNSTYLKARIKTNGVFDVLSMSLFSMTTIPDWYYVSIINSELISLYVDNFINNTSHFQINDARQLPIIVPSEKQMMELHTIYSELLMNKKRNSEINIPPTIINNTKEIELQHKLDIMVKKIYHIL